MSDQNPWKIPENLKNNEMFQSEKSQESSDQKVEELIDYE